MPVWQRWCKHRRWSRLDWTDRPGVGSHRKTAQSTRAEPVWEHGDTAKGLAKLAAFPKLLRLDASQISFEDRDVPALSSLRQLKRLQLSRTNITPDGLARLRTALPSTSIEIDNLRAGPKDDEKEEEEEADKEDGASSLTPVEPEQENRPK